MSEQEINPCDIGVHEYINEHGICVNCGKSGGETASQIDRGPNRDSSEFQPPCTQDGGHEYVTSDGEQRCINCGESKPGPAAIRK